MEEILDSETTYFTSVVVRATIYTATPKQKDIGISRMFETPMLLEKDREDVLREIEYLAEAHGSIANNINMTIKHHTFND